LLQIVLSSGGILRSRCDKAAQWSKDSLFNAVLHRRSNAGTDETSSATPDKVKSLESNVESRYRSAAGIRARRSMRQSALPDRNCEYPDGFGAYKAACGVHGRHQNVHRKRQRLEQYRLSNEPIFMIKEWCRLGERHFRFNFYIEQPRNPAPHLF